MKKNYNHLYTLYLKYIYFYFSDMQKHGVPLKPPKLLDASQKVDFGSHPYSNLCISGTIDFLLWLSDKRKTWVYSLLCGLTNGTTILSQ